ncbi:hypothetical protein Q6D67_04045 [Haliea sp. E1-2-M8]|uniref:ankyrin repeat domain-containing protein n=1 Tax=Haliea sp. E1-2-M8 TaxID=3064706 RepID=UPI0027227352|nr:ankyrin repeat domain-containing protein [Haliea sp. E1-2-M8]MDO8860865.1 hypothetical protein [Haliea sp. E1-2-M8]
MKLEVVGESPVTPLMIVAQKSSQEHVKALVESGADVNVIQPTEASFSPLALAVCRGQRVVAGLLLAHGADPFWKNTLGMNIIKMAVTNNIGTLSEPTLHKLAALGVPTLKALSLLCCAMMYAAGSEIDQNYLVRLEKEILDLLGNSTKPAKAQVRSVISSLR